MTEESLMRVVDIAPTLGIGADALRRALRDRGHKVYQVDRYSAVSVDAVEKLVAHQERYATIVTRRPKGWLSPDAVAELLEIDRTGVWNLLRCKKLKAVRYKGLYLYDPEAVEHYRLTRPRILPTWVPLVDVGRMMKLDPAELDDLPRAARALGFEVRRMEQPTRSKGTKTRVCIREADVAALVEARSKKPPADYIRADKVAQLAGVHFSTVMRWKSQGLPSEQDWHGYFYFDLLETVAWLRKSPMRGAKERADQLLENMHQQRQPRMRILKNCVPHLLLSAACAEPLSVRDLMARVSQPVDLDSARKAARQLRNAGYLKVAQHGRCERGRQIALYTLTPAGEGVLDELGVWP